MTVLDCFDVDDEPDADAHRFRFTLKSGSRASLVASLADVIALSCAGSDQGIYDAWRLRCDGGPDHDRGMARRVAAMIGPDFIPPDGNDDGTRLRGAVVEHLWACVAEDLDGGWGTPLSVARDHFSVTDPGGDGVSIYELDGSEMGFRLWESKSHVGGDYVTRSVTNAAIQLRDRGDQYLARFSKVIQLDADPRVQSLGAEMLELWVEESERSAVGVVVGTHTEKPVPKRPFTGLRKNFGFDELARRERVLFVIDDLTGFCEDVQAVLLRGIE